MKNQVTKYSNDSTFRKTIICIGIHRKMKGRIYEKMLRMDMLSDGPVIFNFVSLDFLIFCGVQAFMHGLWGKKEPSIGFHNTS